MADLKLKGLDKIYPNGVQAVFDFNLDIEDGEFIVLVGPSGCGKSTTLRMVAGLEEISNGVLEIDGKGVTNVAAKDRDIAMVFQNYALYGHKTVYDNMAFSLDLRGIDPDETYEKVISTGAGIMYAHAALNVLQQELWRDYTHLSDYGRLIAAYTFYAQFTGNPITQINIDTIPAALRQARSRAKGDLIVTEEMKQVIMDAANHALEDPWSAPSRPDAN